jgi:hypothetical protein
VLPCIHAELARCRDNSSTSVPVGFSISKNGWGLPTAERFVPNVVTQHSSITLKLICSRSPAASRRQQRGAVDTADGYHWPADCQGMPWHLLCTIGTVSLIEAHLMGSGSLGRLITLNAAVEPRKLRACGHAGVLRAWGSRMTTSTHHCSAETALGVDARAAGHNTPWVILARSARVWCSSTPIG